MTPGAVHGGSIGGYQPPFQRSEASEYQKSAADRFRSAAAAYANPQNQTGLDHVFESLYPVIVPDANSAIIPGAGADCGLEDRYSKRMVLCSHDPSHSHYEVGGSSCGKPDCPRHWRTWACRAADRLGVRVWGYKEASKGRHNPRHTVLSLADDDPLVDKRVSHTDRANVKYFRKYFAARAVSLGGIGGSVVIHLWRTNDNVPHNIEGSTRWDWVRKQLNWREYTKFSPHAHVIGYGFYAEPEPGDFSYKNFPALRDRDAIESVAYYQVSHAPVGVGNAVAYWGCCQSGYLKVVSKWHESRQVYCADCGAHMVYEDSGEIYTRKRSMAEYRVVDPPCCCCDAAR